MRAFAVLLLVALAGCPIRGAETAGADLSDDDNGGGAGAIPQSCRDERDCELSAATCCDCPAFAVNKNDPAFRACAGVMCPMDSCPDNVHAACDNGACVLACTELTCAQSCGAGYVIDETTGCLSCACAAPEPGGCVIDNDCVETRADCCGCHAGGEDTAVLASQRALFDAALGCPQSPACPAINVCEPGAAPHCVQGRCELITSTGLPANACGRSDLPACPSGQICTINKDPQAGLLGVGVCAPEPPAGP